MRVMYKIQYNGTHSVYCTSELYTSTLGNCISTVGISSHRGVLLTGKRGTITYVHKLAIIRHLWERLKILPIVFKRHN